LASENGKYVSIDNASNADVTNATYTDWGSNATVDVPSWATKARLVVSLTNISGVSAVAVSNIRTVIGSNTGKEIRHVSNTDAHSQPLTYSDEIILSATGTQIIKLQAKRDSGGGALRANGGGVLLGANFSFFIVFLP